jgi:hypothetical protein
MSVAQEFLNFSSIDAGVEKEGGFVARKKWGV